MLFYKSFATNEFLSALPYQNEAYANAVERNEHKYDKNGYSFTLQHLQIW